MPMIKNLLGLDVGSHTVKAVELRQTLRGLEPVQLRIHPRTEAEAPVGEILRHFVKLQGLSTEHVATAIPGDRVSTRRLELPFRDRKKLAQAIPFEIEGDIPFELEEVLLDWEIVGGDRNRTIVAPTIVQRTEVSQILEGLREAGIHPRVLEAEGLVLANLAAIFDIPDTQLLIDLGHRKTTVCLVSDGQPISARTIPVGGLAITKAIASNHGCSLEDAEREKCEDGIFHLGFSSATPAAVAVLDRIAREVVRTLESFEPFLGGSIESAVAGLTLFGGTARLHRIDEYLAERTGVAAARLALRPDSPQAGLIAGGDPLVFAPAIALALRATAKTRTRMNFRQDEFAYRTDLSQIFGRDMRTTGILAAGAAGLLIASFATSVSLEARRAGALESRVAHLYSEAFPGQAAPSNPVANMSQAVASVRDRADFLGVYGGDHSALDLLAELSRRIPEDLEVKFEEVNIDPRVIRIKVFAKDFEAPDRLTSVLSASPPFTSTKVAGEISSEQRREGITFSLNISLDAGGETT